MKYSVRYWGIRFVILGFFLTMLAAPSPVRAATTQQAGFAVTPAQVSLTIQPDAQNQTSTLVITNSYDSSLRLVADLRSIDESAARLIPTGPIDAKLGQAIKLSATDIIVPPEGSYRLQIAVDGSSLSDGGHYASLVLAQRQATTGASGFLSAVAVNLFIIKNENIRTNLQLADLHTNQTIFSLPSSVTATFKNGGNTHVIPRASVSIYAGQALIAKSVINENSLPLFPGQHAKFSASFQTYTGLFLPRKLNVHTMYRIDGADVQLIKDQVFFYVPLVDVLTITIIACAAWWYRRPIQRFITKWAKKFGSKSRSKNRKNVKQIATPLASTRRMLGRTVIRTHQVASRPLARAIPVISTSKQAEHQPQQHPQKHITVTIAEEPVIIPRKTEVQGQSTKRVVKAKVLKPTTTSKRSKTQKTTSKTSTAKTSKKPSATTKKKTSAKTRKTAASAKNSKTV